MQLVPFHNLFVVEEMSIFVLILQLWTDFPPKTALPVSVLVMLAAILYRFGLRAERKLCHFRLADFDTVERRGEGRFILKSTVPGLAVRRVCAPSS